MERSTVSTRTNSMMVSGYTDRVRRDIIKGGLERKHQVENVIEKGTWLRFRTREEIYEMKGSN